jgi:DNA-binding transcriptional LysR family regulator
LTPWSEPLGRISLDLLSLQLFVAVCEEQSIARAADREHIAASAVSKRIPISKFVSTRRSSIEYQGSGTDGRRLYAAASFARADARPEADGNRTRPSCEQRQRPSAYLCQRLDHYPALPSDLREFLANHSAIRINLQEGTSQQAVDAVAENPADIGVFGGVVPRAGLRIIPYRADRLVVLMHVDHPLAKRAAVRFEDLSERDLIGPSKGSCLDSLVLRAAMRRQYPQGGRIISNGSVSAKVPRLNSIAYTASKRAATGITRSLSLDGRHSISPRADRHRQCRYGHGHQIGLLSRCPAIVNRIPRCPSAARRCCLFEP